MMMRDQTEQLLVHCFFYLSSSIGFDTRITVSASSKKLSTAGMIVFCVR